MKVTTISLSKLRNNEYYRFMMEVKDIIGSAFINLTAAASTMNNLETLWKKMKDLLKLLDVAIISLDKSELTQPVVEADVVRDKVYRGLVLYVEAYSNSMEAEDVEAARRLQVLIDNYGDFRRRPFNEESAMIDNFLQDLKMMHMDNMEAIGADDWLTQLENSNNEFKKLTNDRHDEWVMQIREEVYGLRVQIDEVYHQIINLLEIGSTLEGGIYSKLIDKVSERVSYYKNTLATRKGRLDAKKEEEGTEECPEGQDEW